MKTIIALGLDVYKIPGVFQEDIQILKMNGGRIPVVNMYCGNQPVLICEKVVSNVIAQVSSVNEHIGHGVLTRGWYASVSLTWVSFNLCAFILIKVFFF